MSNPALHHKINYVEFTTTDIERTKKFYSTIFGLPMLVLGVGLFARRRALAGGGK